MSATATDRPVRLLHLSDCRFRADRAREADPVLRDLARFIAAEVAGGLAPDLVVITGDLGYSGKAEEYQPGRKRKSEELPCSAQEWLLGRYQINQFQWIELYPRPRCVRVLFRLHNQGAWQPDYNQSGGAVEFALDQPPTANTATQSAHAPYLAWLHRRYADFDLLGKGLKQGQAIRLSQVYVPAVTTPAADPAGPDLESARNQANHAGRPEQPPPALLLERIDRQSLYCPAAAGAGKTTFCRWAVLRASAGEPGVGHSTLPPAGFAEQPPTGLHGRLPLLVPLWDLWPNMECGHGRGNWHRPQLEQALAQWVDRIRPDGLPGCCCRSRSGGPPSTI